MAGFVTRFAPSPTGFLHRGHAASALAAWSAAQAHPHRTFLLRIEDIDATRCRPQYEQAIYDDLAWLGLTWEHPVRRQSEHLADYFAALETLRRRGLVYRCFRTRKQVLDDIARAPHGPGEVFRGAPLPPKDEARRLEAGEPYAWRLSLDAAHETLGASYDRLSFVDETGEVAARPDLAGDVVLARKDVGVAYHLAVTVDDALQGVTHVIRGEDLRDAAHIHRLLQALLDLPTPVYRHHPLVLGPDGRRLAKRDMAETLRDLGARSVTADEVRSSVGY
ncbi:MAG: tRNA glutamyl-Q(34) synthetase GluQRS [Brevundimonas sp.]|nr:MAG: tRNA glutamyl-Q(34) synthetase GluQRS [Brevundimonas sp.]